MDGIHFTLRTSVSFLLLILLQSSAEAQICEEPAPVQFNENNAVGDVVLTITVQEGVNLTFNPPPANPDNPFAFNGNQMIATRVLDYETTKRYTVQITCTKTNTSETLSHAFVVFLVNLNDNAPVFEKDLYNDNVDEMSPVGTTVGRYAAKDLDNPPQLFYRLEPDSDDFGLKSETNPDILVKSLLDYDKVKNVQLVLYAQDTPLATEVSPSYTATTTIMVTILDVDNRPPWFQPCTKQEIGGAVICYSAGYKGNVTLNEKETDVLPLSPGPLYAIDGDSGLNEEITYSFLNGNEGGLFNINPNTGNITMQKPTDVLGPISLTVVAAQTRNSYQFATIDVTIKVNVKSEKPPKFQKSLYEGVVSSVGSMVMDAEDKPLKIIALDEDYSATEGINPNIKYYSNRSSDFSIIDGYIFMTTDLQEGTLSLKLVAEDTSNNERDEAKLSLEVQTGLTTTSLPPSTTDMVTTATEESTESYTSNVVIIPPEGYGPWDMAALGVTLGVLLFICLVVIGLLAHRIQRWKTDCRKISEASLFQRSLSQASAGNKDGIQYTNEAFQKDEDGRSTGSNSPDGGHIKAGKEPLYENDSLKKSSLLLNSPQEDNTSLPDSDTTGSEKEVKPILTKERRVEEGYKSVWFKEDIDPDAKEEVVIIPDSRENDSEEEDEEQSFSGREEDEDEKQPMKTPKVGFTGSDLDGGLRETMGDAAEDSEDDEGLNVEL